MMFSTSREGVVHGARGWPRRIPDAEQERQAQNLRAAALVARDVCRAVTPLAHRAVGDQRDGESSKEQKRPGGMVPPRRVQ